MGMAYAQDPQGWKRPWGLWGVGLRLKEQKGPRHDPHPWYQRAADLTWEPSKLLGLSGWSKCSLLLSCSSSLGSGRAPQPASPDLPGLPPVAPGPMRAGWGFGGGWPEWAR